MHVLVENDTKALYVLFLAPDELFVNASSISREVHLVP